MLEAVSRSGDHFTKKADETVTWTPYDSAPITFHLNAEKLPPTRQRWLHQAQFQHCTIGLVGLGVGAWKVGTHAAGWAHDAHVVSNESNYSKEQVATAHGDLRYVEAETALVTAGVAGGLAVAPFAAGALQSIAGSADRAALASDTSGFQSGASGEDTVTGILGRAVQSGQYEVRDVKGVSVLFPRAQPTASDILSDALTSGQYEVQDINGVSVMMPKAQPTVMDILANAVKSGKYRADTVNGVTVFNPS